VATAGQAEIDMRFDSLVNMADKLQWYKYIIKQVARRHNKTATFMPKPLFNDNGSGMHTHQSLWKGDQPLFAGDGYSGVARRVCTTLVGFSDTLRLSVLSSRLRPTRINAWCLALKRR